MKIQRRILPIILIRSQTRISGVLLSNFEKIIQILKQRRTHQEIRHFCSLDTLIAISKIMIKLILQFVNKLAKNKVYYVVNHCNQFVKNFKISFLNSLLICKKLLIAKAGQKFWLESFDFVDSKTIWNGKSTSGYLKETTFPII